MRSRAFFVEGQIRSERFGVDVRSLAVDDFDVVVFSGVYYHLKHPLLALAVLRR